MWWGCAFSAAIDAPAEIRSRMEMWGRNMGKSEVGVLHCAYGVMSPVPRLPASLMICKGLNFAFACDLAID